MHMDIGPHVADDVLEQYLLKRLAEEELASVEEHLLVCMDCQVQAEQTEEFILVTKAAIRSGKGKVPGRAMHAGAGFLQSWLTVPAFAAMAVAVAAAVFLPVPRGGGNMAPTEVTLHTMRGPDVIPHVRAGGSLLLDLDVTGLPAGEYGVRLVNSSGTEMWSGASHPAGTNIRARVGVKLGAGRYWVRLTRGGESVREYGLQID